MNMKAPLLLLLLTVCPAGGGRLPRDVWELGEMISCTENGTNPLRYNDYGCWCGLGGGGAPVDGVDSCCKVHDNCYGVSMTTPGCTDLFDLPYVLDYDYVCTNELICLETNDKCMALVCECDRAVARCFAQNKYNPDYKNLDREVHCVS